MNDVKSDVKVSECSRREILVPCSLDGFEHQIDPYIGCEHYCKYCYVLNQAETDWTREILIHRDISAQLSEELHGIGTQRVYMGYLTDPYQPCEREHRQTRKVLELLAGKGFSVGILTKSDLVLRDIDVLSQMSDASISVSVAFHDNFIRRLLEHNTIDTEDRIAALHKLKEAGIRTTAMLCPVIPWVTDVKRLIEELTPCAEVIWVYGLSIMDRSDQNWLDVKTILESEYPDTCRQIEEAIFDREHSFWTDLRQELTELQGKTRSKLNIRI